MCVILSYFNPRSHEGSDYKDNYNMQIKLYFNPRSHEGSDLLPEEIRMVLTISIHAPTRGATQIDRCIDVNLIFQSTLPRGERLVTASNVAMIDDFNPRSHEGSDLCPLTV